MKRELLDFKDLPLAEGPVAPPSDLVVRFFVWLKETLIQFLSHVQNLHVSSLSATPFAAPFS